MIIALRLDGGESMGATALSEGWEEREVWSFLGGDWTWCLDGDKKAAQSRIRKLGTAIRSG